MSLTMKLRVGAATIALLCPAVAVAADTAKAAVPGIAEGSDIVVTATKANEIAPVTASLQTTQPQAIISRSFIEDSLPATADFNSIALISPSVSNYGNNNGVGLSESKAQIRGFQDGEYNITFDGVPFGDTNDPTHHSNTFFPSNTIETLIVDRGPGNASNLGQATFGGSINLFSRETRPDIGGEVLATAGSYNTYLIRGLLQSGAVRQLGGSEFLLTGQHIYSAGHLTFEHFKSDNIFFKGVIPIGPSVRVTLIGTYNENKFNQPDNDGATRAQVAQFGQWFSLNNDPTTQNYYRYNTTHKTTDFEIVRIEADIAKGLTLDNRTYTYYYDNETLSGNNTTLIATDTPANVAAANMVTLATGAKKVVGVPGYTKTNQYRVYGDIAKAHYDIGFATLTAGGWIERSDTYRQQRDVDLATGLFDYREKAVSSPAGVATPQYIRFDQNSSVDHYEAFGELEVRPIDSIKITPGVKYVSFKRNIDALYNQTTRYPQQVSNTYTSTLPFVTVNYQPIDKVAVYGQFAKGFLIPPLSQLYVPNPSFSPAAPQKSTNYQAGAVFHGEHLSADADIYYIDFSNKFLSTQVQGQGTVFVNSGGAIYKGVEGEITYALNNGIAVFGNASRNYAESNNPGVPHAQVANAPFWTAAAGVLYKRGPIKFSLIDKYTGTQYGAEGQPAAYRISGYNTAIVSASYQVGPARIGVEVTDLFDSTKITRISAGGGTFDQLYFQPGRAIQGEVRFFF